MTIEAEVSSMMPEPSREKQKGKIKSALERFTQRVQEVGVSYRVTAVEAAADDENESDLAKHSAVEARPKDVAFNDEDFSLKKPSFKLKEVLSRELFNKVQDLNKQMTMLGSQTRIMDNTGPDNNDEHPAGFAGPQDRQSPSVASPRSYDSNHLALFSQEEKPGQNIRPVSKTKAAPKKPKKKLSAKQRKPKQK